MERTARSKTRSSAVAAGFPFPDDIMVKILSHVPSICRFKCVSKAWHDLIVDPDHRKKLCQAMQGLFFMTSSEKARFDFGFMGLKTGSSLTLDVYPGFSFPTERPGNHNLVLLDCFSFLTERTGNHNLVLLDSCNGLLLFRHQREPPHYDDALGYIVCNPTTKQWEAVPIYSPPRGVRSHAYLAFYPTVSSHFNLVVFQQIDIYKAELASVHAYSSETGTWNHHNQTEEEKEQGQSVGWWNHVHIDASYGCAFVNGFLHLIIWGSNNKKQIVVVDVQGRARRMIKLPNVFDANRGICICSYIYFGQSQGYLHCITKGSFDFVEKTYKLYIWVLQDYDAEEWVLKNTVSSLQLYGENCQRSFDISEREVADMHLDCNVVFFFSPCEHKFIAYDMDRKEVSISGATSKRISRLKVARYVPHFSENHWRLSNKH